MASIVNKIIEGEGRGDSFGHSVSISSDGSVLAISAPNNEGTLTSIDVPGFGTISENTLLYYQTNGNSDWSLDSPTDSDYVPAHVKQGINPGSVKVYKNNGIEWVQLGNEITGEGLYDQIGISISLSSNGETLAIGNALDLSSDLNTYGSVSIYGLNDEIWTQIGSDITSSQSFDYFGYSTSLSSDGKTLATGGFYGELGTATDNAGYVKIYENVNGNFIQVGDTLYGEDINGDEFGFSVDLSSDGSIVAISSAQGGDVFIYQKNGSSWSQLGSKIAFNDYSSDIKDGSVGKEEAVVQVKISEDGNYVAIGCPIADIGGTNTGKISVFKNISQNWVQVGDDINGENLDHLGTYIDIEEDSNGFLTFAASGTKENGESYVNVYKLFGSDWISFATFDSTDNQNFPTNALDLSEDARFLAIGTSHSPVNSTNYDDNFLSAGYIGFNEDTGNVRVYDLSVSDSSGSDSSGSDSSGSDSSSSDSSGSDSSGSDSSSSDSSSSSSSFSTTRDNIKVETSEGTYYIIKEAKTYSDAKTAAESDGGFLASFETENEYTLLYNAVASEYASDSSWGANTIGAGNGVYLRIGGTDGNTVSRYDSSDSDWNWKWVSDNSEISKSRSEWGEGTIGQEPDNYFSEGQDSLAMGLTGWGGSDRNKYGDAGEWNDVRDSSELYYLVEVSSPSASSDSSSSSSSTQIKVADVNSSYVADAKGFASITGSTPVTVTSYEIGKETTLDSIKDYDGNLHAGDNLEETASSYKYQGMLDVNGDGVFETIFTNKSSKRWVTAKVDSTTGQIDFDDNGAGGGTRVVGIYADPLIAEGENNGGYLSDGVTPAPANFGVSDADRYVVVNGETIDRLALNSQVRFQNDLEIDNLQAKHSGDYDSDGIHEVYWKTNDGTAYLRSLMHADGNIRYANYQSEAQMKEYLTANGDDYVITDITS